MAHFRTHSLIRTAQSCERMARRQTKLATIRLCYQGALRRLDQALAHATRQEREAIRRAADQVRAQFNRKRAADMKIARLLGVPVMAINPGWLQAA
jgi:hypothetical protein